MQSIRPSDNYKGESENECDMRVLQEGNRIEVCTLFRWVVGTKMVLCGMLVTISLYWKKGDKR
jgi:hypothetical protein